ncbi:family 20 glycosylhydrolase [Urechidicola vernalis]|uniref:beta-N-acetylhexosaminidase n=1 Tax=Urechidicola vernalis TaxID=3075600 RepID=A0ABU2Y6B2_9FLAO|nr:family 20 glycosylhydrolase [Urechidicola sp. P050]MDT0553232.1 family 20 glycosylhydrolase [Urechidicola sp. P050]
MKFLKPIVTIVAITLFSCITESKVFTEKDITIIPKPVKTELGQGNYIIDKNTVIVTTEGVNKNTITPFTNQFKIVAGTALKQVTSDNKPSSNYIELLIDISLEKEAYKLQVTKNGVSISASDHNGFVYAIQSLRQLLPTEFESTSMQNTSWILPEVTIEDAPRFAYRGLMLDVSRHFFDKDYVLKTIDRLAYHKMNVLHLHLVDDQGWRIEIKKYPKLTEVGGFRVDQEDAAWSARDVNKPSDQVTFGGFYTQEEIKEIVSYATSKGIDVIPEIEMPAHVMSAVAAYPELSCFETPIGVPSGGVWPITEIYCAGKESTFDFLENVLTEVMDLFPSKYIHIGGDEATKTNWATCPHCKKRMNTEGLHDVEELQSYFIKRMEKFIKKNGRKLVGWDEIIEGGLAPDATVMSWRGVKGGLEAAKQGHDVIMTPGTHCYFDHYQGPQNEEPVAWGGYTTLSKVYQFNPIVDSMTKEEAAHVLGGQANLWSEYVPSNEHSEYMIFPRLAAMSEALWSPTESRDWDDFSIRIESLFERYKHQGINYAESAYLVTENTEINIENKTVQLFLKNEFPVSDIRYNLTNEPLDNSAIKYTEPIQLTKTTNIKASLYKNDKPIGREFNKTIKFHEAVGKKVTYTEEPNKRYQGVGNFNMVNSLRGTKNFHDGQWQAWLNKDMEIVIDLGTKIDMNKVTVGSMESQGPGIYYPIAVEISISNDGKSFKKVGETKRDFVKSGDVTLKDFVVEFTKTNSQFVQIKAINYSNIAPNGGIFLFVDEILIE